LEARRWGSVSIRDKKISLEESEIQHHHDSEDDEHENELITVPMAKNCYESISEAMEQLFKFGEEL
jgi:hypothetical protein